MLTLKIFNYHRGDFTEKTLTTKTGADNSWLIGRASNCDLVLAAPEVSRVHGKITYLQDQYFYTDLGSTDGSRLNNEPLEINHKYPLKQDDLIRVGDFVLAIQSLETPEITLSHGQKDSNNYWTKGDLIVNCVRIIEETEDVKTFSFQANPSRLFAYQPGQFVTIEVEIDGKPVQRAYSISSTPSRPELLEITVKRVGSASPDLPPGLVSNWLHDNIIIGSKVKLLGGPMGNFTCANQSPEKVLLISAGSGITPMISMTRWLYDQAASTDVVFFHSARTPQDIIMRHELELMAARWSRLRLAMTITKPAIGQSWLGFTGRLTDSLLLNMVPDYQSRTVYVCGPDNFMSGVKEMFTQLNFPMTNYHQESFGVGKKVSKPETVPVSEAVHVVFSKSAKQVTCQPQESILAVAQQQGVPIRSACLQGVCGACKQRQVEGEVTYGGEPVALTEEEKKAGFILPCIAFPVGKVVVEV